MDKMAPESPSKTLNVVKAERTASCSCGLCFYAKLYTLHHAYSVAEPCRAIWTDVDTCK